mmetsp:Transcript_60396/g.197638  ORF Transcript_60396/g.197638 Transcript_60396/m.197638 type:complete len:410 (+) Transcript_60396:2721-3950(+)
MARQVLFRSVLAHRTLHASLARTIGVHLVAERTGKEVELPLLPGGQRQRQPRDAVDVHGLHIELCVALPGADSLRQRLHLLNQALRVRTHPIGSKSQHAIEAGELQISNCLTEQLLLHGTRAGGRKSRQQGDARCGGPGSMLRGELTKALCVGGSKSCGGAEDAAGTLAANAPCPGGGAEQAAGAADADVLNEGLRGGPGQHNRLSLHAQGLGGEQHADRVLDGVAAHEHINGRVREHPEVLRERTRLADLAAQCDAETQRLGLSDYTSAEGSSPGRGVAGRPGHAEGPEASLVQSEQGICNAVGSASRDREHAIRCTRHARQQECRVVHHHSATVPCDNNRRSDQRRADGAQQHRVAVCGDEGFVKFHDLALRIPIVSNVQHQGQVPAVGGAKCSIATHTSVRQRLLQ